MTTQTKTKQNCFLANMNGLLYGGGCILLVFHLANSQLIQKSPTKWLDLSSSGNRLTVLCRFLSLVERLQTISPLPSQLLHLHSQHSFDSPFDQLNKQVNRSQCPSLTTLTTRNHTKLTRSELKSLSNVKGKLLLLECSNDHRIGLTQCAQMLIQLCTHNMADGLVSRRLFVVVIVYEDNSSNLIAHKMAQTLLHSDALSKVHAAIVVYHLNRSEAKFNFDRINYVRPLKNSCLIDRDFSETKQLEVNVLSHNLLAVDKTQKAIPCNFLNSKLTAVVTKSFFCEFTSNEEGEIKLNPSLELNAFKLLSEKYHFTYDAIDANGSYGRKDGNAWLGSIGYLVNKTADLALCDLIYTYDRSVVVDFTFPYDMEPISFLTKKPGFRVRKWAFFFALPIDIWAITFCTFLVLGIILNMAIRFRMLVLERKEHNYSPFMLLLSIFFQQSFSQQEMNGLNNFEIRFIIIMWSFASLIIMRCYSGIFYSSITVPEPVPPIDTVDEVHRAAVQDTAVVFTSRYMYDMAIVAKCCGTFDYDLGQHVRRNPHLAAQLNANFDTHIDNLEHYQWNKLKPLLFITSRSILMILSQYITYSLHVSSATFMLDALGIAYLKDALYGPYFGETILRMMETGLIDKWFRDTLLEHEHRAFQRRQMKKRKFQISSDDKHKSISSTSTSKSMAEQEAENIHNFRIDELESVFVLYLCGNMVAILAFLIHFAAKHATTMTPSQHNRLAL